MQFYTLQIHSADSIKNVGSNEDKNHNKNVQQYNHSLDLS